MSHRVTLRARNSREALAPAGRAAEDWLRSHRAPPACIYLTLLAIEELATNCIKYAYDDDRQHEIEIELALTPRALTIAVIDDGHPFDPLAVPPPDMHPEIEDRPIGGLGIHVLRTLADQMTYERRDETNRVTLTKQIR